MIWWLALVLGLAALGVWVWWYISSRPLTVFELGFPTKILKAGDWDFHYYDEGRGEVVILLHGIGANILCWRRLWPLLTEKMRVIAVDLPGFGRSSKHAALYGLDDQISRLKEFLDGLGVREAHFIGNSMGANIALWFAAHFPERTSSVTVIAPATSGKLVPAALTHLSRAAGPLSYLLAKPAVAWAHRRTVTQKQLVDVVRISETYRTYGRQPGAVRSFFLAMQAIQDPRILLTVPRIQDEVLILWGRGDRLVPWSVVDSLQASLKKSRVKIHEDGGHHLQEDDPAWVAKEFLEAFGPKQN